MNTQLPHPEEAYLYLRALRDGVQPPRDDDEEGADDDAHKVADDDDPVAAYCRAEGLVEIVPYSPLNPEKVAIEWMAEQGVPETQANIVKWTEAANKCFGLDGMMRRISDRGRAALFQWERTAGEVAPPQTQQPAPAEPSLTPAFPQVPKKLLVGWREITKELGEKYADRDKVKSLNDRLNGPIRLPPGKGQGARPFVYRDDLIEWWNALAVQAEDTSNQERGRKLTAEAQYAHGRNGTAAPEVGGEVKKRRKKRT